MGYQEQSKAFLEALSLNAVTCEHIVKWADSIIVKEDEPKVEIIELSLSKTSSEAVSHLKTLSLGADEEESYKLLFGILGKALSDGRVGYEEVAKKLYFWSMYETELKGYGELCSYWDEIDLADRGVFGDPIEVRSRMLNFLLGQ